MNCTLTEFLYNGHVISTRIFLNGAARGHDFKIDTGSPITIINAKHLAEITGYSVQTIKSFIHSKPAKVFHSFTNDTIHAVPCVLRNVQVGFGGYSGGCIAVNKFMVYVTDAEAGNNLLGLDFIAACSGTYAYGRMVVDSFNENNYHGNFLQYCGGVQPYEVSEIKAIDDAVSNAVDQLLSQAEGNK